MAKKRRVTGYLKPILAKYFMGDLNIKLSKDIIKGESELINDIVEQHYSKLSEAQKNELINQSKKSV